MQKTASTKKGLKKNHRTPVQTSIQKLNVFFCHFEPVWLHIMSSFPAKGIEIGFPYKKPTALSSARET